jgi:hypothetical protein
MIGRVCPWLDGDLPIPVSVAHDRHRALGMVEHGLADRSEQTYPGLHSVASRPWSEE